MAKLEENVIFKLGSIIRRPKTLCVRIFSPIGRLSQNGVVALFCDIYGKSREQISF